MMNRYATFVIIYGVITLTALATNVRAADEQRGPFFAMTEENDIFSDHNQDRHYTQGLKLTYLGGDDDFPQWVKNASEALPRIGIDVSAQNLGFDFGQNIYTPQDLRTKALVKTDRPYGGWSYIGMFLQRRGEVDTTKIPVLESFEVDLGIAGPESLAGGAQVNFHEWFCPGKVPRGWRNQLEDEPGLLLKYERLWRLSFNDQTAHYIDLIPHVGGELGNIAILGNAGATLRLGWNLPDDFGVQVIDSPVSLGGGITPSSPPFSFYAFGGADGRAVGHNLFLDGNTFRGGPSVDRVPWVADLSFGVAMRLCRHFELAYTRIERTREYVGQHNNDVFGSITAKAMFPF
jgi:lipid A 3-O-deacylase